ncbi:hypothetical protein [Psychroserpens damuponensis]|uniref:hypothetical protein n=1 Tax=Psychroserpens damuponensis TaxID=943936 RepID=UPI00058F7ACA|nr:hypothetical protein [Psychroserpens damuponensis]
MKNYIKVILLTLVLNSCGKAINTIAIEDEMEHSETLTLQKGDNIKFWTKLNYRYQNAIDLTYSVSIYKNDTLYTYYNYSPLTTNPRYLSSDERWIISKKRNPDWVKYNKRRLTLLGWRDNEDLREEYQKQKHIITYGIKKIVKGKNEPIFTVKEDGVYTFKAKLHVSSNDVFKINKATIILKK